MCLSVRSHTFYFHITFHLPLLYSLFFHVFFIIITIVPCVRFIRFITSLLIIKILNFPRCVSVCAMCVFPHVSNVCSCVWVKVSVYNGVCVFCSIKLLNPLFYDSLLTIFVLISVWPPHCWINTDFFLLICESFVNIGKGKKFVVVTNKPLAWPHTLAWAFIRSRVSAQLYSEYEKETKQIAKETTVAQLI